MIKTRRLFLAVCMFFLIGVGAVSAESETVGVGLYLINIGNYDISKGTYTADFYIYFNCTQNCSASTNFEFINGRADSIDPNDILANEHYYRVYASLLSPVDLRKFPFDIQKFNILIEDKRRTTDELVYVPLIDKSSVDEGITATGWKVVNWSVTAKDHYYAVYDETYSQYVFTMTMSRTILSSVLKTFLPVVFIILIVLFSYILGLDQLPNQLTLIGSGLVAAVMFHVSISNDLPPLGYLTFADKFMILTYFVLLSTMIISIILLVLLEHKKRKLASRIHKITELAVWIIVPAIYYILFNFFL